MALYRPGLRLLERFVRPHPRIANNEDRVRARLFAILMLVHVLLSLAFLPAINYYWSSTTGLSIWEDHDVRSMLAGLCLILVAFSLLRCGFYRIGVFFYLLVTIAVPVIVPFMANSNGEIALLATAIIPIVLSAIAFSYRWVFGILLMTIGTGIFQLLLAPMPVRQKFTGYSMLAVIAVSGILLLIFRHHLEVLERQRIQQIQDGQEAIRKSAEQYRQLFETVTDGIMIADARGRILEVNDGACRQLGYSRSEMLNLSLDRISARAPEDVKSALRSVEERGHAFYQTSHVRKDGSTIPIELAITAVEFDGAMAFLGVARDLTERRRIEEEKQRLEGQLQQASKMESIGLLAGGVAHDFNNLLTTILGNVELALLDAPQGSTLGEMLLQIQRAGQSAASLTRQLLAFSRKQIILPRVLDLNDLVTQLHNMLTRFMGEDVRLKILPAPNPASIKADPALVEQVILNLAGNARDAMPEGGDLTIQIANATLDQAYAAKHPGSQPGEYVALLVADTGAGIPPDIRERIFEPFFTTKPKGRGTGLGLATSYGAIKQSGGFIEVQSQTGRGTTFKVYFPRAHEPEESVARHEQPLLRGTETILVVEDDKEVMYLATRILTKLGYVIIAAANPVEAIIQAQNYTGLIHLLISDVVMPGLDGGQLAERIIRISPRTRVLYTSGYAEDVIVHRGVLDDNIAFLAKPYTARTLGAKVREVLDRQPPPHY